MTDSGETAGRGPSRPVCSMARARRWLPSATALLIPVGALLAGCSRPQPKPPALTVGSVDSVLAELGGSLTDSLSREQRWRLISSVGTGLPPQDFKLADLPEPKSYGATMLQVYCQQCHWLPSPQMHSATEWPILIRRMLLRGRLLKERLGGPRTSSLVGGLMVDVMKDVTNPTPDQVDSLLAYLKRNALPVAKPGEIGDSPAAQVFVAKCSVCHETPSPTAHVADEWDGVIARMQSNMARMGVPQLGVDDLNQITAFLKAHARSR
jgi:cytochrome c5